MKRKDFIKLSAFATVAISIPLLDSCGPSVAERAMSQTGFLSRLFDVKTIKDAGKAYLQKTPAENDDDRLVQLLADNGSITNSTDEKAIHEYLDEKIKQEFETGNTVLVNGWVLAITEARQCALFSLMND